MRRAPRDGYDFGNKRQYRRDVWAALRRTIDVPRRDAQCLLMPSLEGDEIDVVLANGFRESNLHVVDREPAIVATLKRRYARINTYGVEVARACERIAARNIKIDVANFDLCGPIDGPSATTLRDCLVTGAVSDSAAVAVTALRGRERSGYLTFMRDRWKYLSDRDNDELREWQIHISLTSTAIDGSDEPSRGAVPVAFGTYRSTAGTQTFHWIVNRLFPRQVDIRGMFEWCFKSEVMGEKMRKIWGAGATGVALAMAHAESNRPRP